MLKIPASEKVMLTVTPLEWLVTKNIIFHRNVGRKASKNTFESNVLKYFSYFKCFIGLGLDPIRELTASTKLQLERQLAYVS